MRGDNNGCAGGHHIGRRRTPETSCSRADDGGNRHPGDEKERPVLAKHGDAREGASEKGVGDAQPAPGAQVEQQRRRPKRDHDGVGVQNRRLDVVKRNKNERDQPQQRPIFIEMIAQEPPRDGKPGSNHRHVQQVSRPILTGKHRKPQCKQPRRDRWMLVAEGEMLGPEDRFAVVGMHVHGRQRYDVKDHPRRSEGDQRRKHDGALGSFGYKALPDAAEPVEETGNSPACPVGRIPPRYRHRCSGNRP